jgi:hypothetical protein
VVVRSQARVEGGCARRVSASVSALNAFTSPLRVLHERLSVTAGLVRSILVEDHPGVWFEQRCGCVYLLASPREGGLVDEGCTYQFLTFKLLNKRARLRLSNSPLDLESIPARAELFTIAVSKPWFAAAIHKDGAYRTSLAHVSAVHTFPNSPLSSLSLVDIIASPLSQLREEAVALTEESSEVAFHATNTLSLPGPISVITFAQHDTRLIVGLANGAICVYDCGGLFNGYPLPPSPLHTFETSPCPIMSISPNPEGIPELIAVCRESRSKPGSQAVEILNLADASLTGMWTAGPDLETVPSSSKRYYNFKRNTQLTRSISLVVTERKADRFGVQEWWHCDLYPG